MAMLVAVKSAAILRGSSARMRASKVAEDEAGPALIDRISSPVCDAQQIDEILRKKATERFVSKTDYASQ